MRPNWSKLGDLVQKACELYTFSSLMKSFLSKVNPFKPNELSYLYQLDKSISYFRGVGWYIFIIFQISIEGSVSKQ